MNVCTNVYVYAYIKAHEGQQTFSNAEMHARLVPYGHVYYFAGGMPHGETLKITYQHNWLEDWVCCGGGGVHLPYTSFDPEGVL